MWFDESNVASPPRGFPVFAISNTSAVAPVEGKHRTDGSETAVAMRPSVASQTFSAISREYRREFASPNGDRARFLSRSATRMRRLGAGTGTASCLPRRQAS
jgi:hypothetical protein